MIAFFIILTIVMVVAYLLIPVPTGKDPVANSIGDFDFPTNTHSRAVPILFGTSWVSGNNIYYGNLTTSKIKV